MAEQLLAAAKNFAKFVAAGPPKRLYDPTKVTMRGWMKRFSDEWNARGFAYAYNKLRMESKLRADGQLVGIDYNGNKYYENINGPSGHSRWVEYPVVRGTWALEDKYDASMVSPDWHGWLHYMHDKPGNHVSKEFAKPFSMKHSINQTMLRPEYTTPEGTTSKDFSEGLPPAFHMPPGAIGNPKPRGRLGPKYQTWDPSGKKEVSALRNYADNSKTLHIP